MTIGVAGCSHSGGAFGKPWHYYMKEKYGANVIDLSISGGGNEMTIERIKHVLDNNKDVDFYVYQIIDPSRLVLGLYGNDVKDEYKNVANIRYNEDDINSIREFKGIGNYVFKMKENDDYLNKILDSEYSVSKFIENHVLISDFNLKIKVFHTLMAIQHLFNFYNKKVIFFSWSVDILELSKESGYYEILKEMNFIKGNVESFGVKRNLEKVEGDNFHYVTESHKIIFDEFLSEDIDKFIKKVYE